MADLHSCIKAGIGFAAAASLSGLALANDPFSAVPVPALPFTDSGNTCGAGDDWDVACPYTGSTAEDFWYSWVSDGSGLNIDLCTADYDTKVYVLDEFFATVGCNDDACGGTFRSELIVPATNAGDLYYIVVDGWQATDGSSPPECGTYTINISAVAGCDVNCVGTDSGEACGDNDLTGCSTDPPLIGNWGTIADGEVICGTIWADGGFRDLDWFVLDHGGGDITVSGSFEIPGRVWVATYSATCAGIAVIVTEASGAVCGSASATATNAAAGNYFIIIGANTFEGWPCSLNANDYELTVGAQLPCPADLNGDGVVDFNDILEVLSNFGPCP
jgi:hypothetical protein